jgi:RNA polymerase sigma-70 factor (ECF subfamily)
MSHTEAQRHSFASAAPIVTAVDRDFSRIYETWFHEVTRWVRALGAPEADLEDVTQEVFVVVQRTLPGFDGANLPGWLYRIASRQVKDHRRRAWFRNLFLRPRDVPLDEVAAGSPSPAELLERRQMERQLEALLAKLSAKRRAAFVLFEIEGYRCEEIAALENIPVATVWTRLHHARRELAERITDLDARKTP